MILRCLSQINNAYVVFLYWFGCFKNIVGFYRLFMRYCMAIYVLKRIKKGGVMRLFTDKSGICIFSTNNAASDLQAVEIDSIYELIELHPMFNPASLLGCYKFKIADVTKEVFVVPAKGFDEKTECFLTIDFLDNLSMAQIAHQSIDAYPYSAAKRWVNSFRLIVAHTIVYKDKYDLIRMWFDDGSLLTIRVNDVENSVKTVAT